MQSVDRLSLLALSLAVAVAVGLYLSGRTLVATWNFRLLHSKDRPNSRVEIPVYEHDIAGLDGGGGHDLAELFLEVPQTILTSESKLVHARFEQKFVGSKEAAHHLINPYSSDSLYSFGLAAPEVLEVAPKERQVRRLQSSPPAEDGFRITFEWSADCSWTIRPREAGEYTVFVDGIWQTSDGKLMPESEPQTRQFTISALTPIGLSAKTASFLQIASLLVGLIGGVLAFPFFKSLFERRRKSEAKGRSEDSKIIITNGE